MRAQASSRSPHNNCLQYFLRDPVLVLLLLFLYFSFSFIHYVSFASWTFHIEWNKNWFLLYSGCLVFVVVKNWLFIFLCTKTTFNTFLINRYILAASVAAAAAAVVAVVCPFNSDWWSCRPVDTFGSSMLFSDAKMNDNNNKKRFKSTFLIETNGWGQHREWLFSKKKTEISILWHFK